MRAALVAVTFSALLIAGCGEEKAEGDVKAGSDATNKPAAASSSAPDPEKVDVKTEADFEEEAETKITVDNLDDQVDKLAAEIEDDTVD